MSKSVADQLLAKYGNNEPEFIITLPEGEELKFKTPSDYIEIKNVYKKAKSFAKAHLAGKHGNKEIAAVATKDEDLAMMASLISELSIEPKFTVQDVLTLSKHAALIVTHIGGELTKRLTLQSAETEVNELDELGND